MAHLFRQLNNDVFPPINFNLLPAGEGVKIAMEYADFCYKNKYES